MRRSLRLFGLFVAAALVATACSSSGASTAPSKALTKVKFQLQWVTQAQFAGYYAALDQGYFKDQGLEVTLLVGGPDVNNLQVVASDGADLGTSWVPKTLQSREGGTDLVTIAQISQRSGTRRVALLVGGWARIHGMVLLEMHGHTRPESEKP